MLKFAICSLFFVGDAVTAACSASDISFYGMLAAAGGTVVAGLPEAIRWAERLFSAVDV
jgi:hypothetical protein